MTKKKSRGWQLWTDEIEKYIDEKMLLSSVEEFMNLHNPLWHSFRGKTQGDFDSQYPELLQKTYEYERQNPSIGGGRRLLGRLPDDVCLFQSARYYINGEKSWAVSRVLHTLNQTKFERVLKKLKLQEGIA